MRKLMLATTAMVALAGAGQAEEVKIGVILGFTGPLDQITPNMANGAELAIKEANEAGNFLNGSTVVSVRADSTCVDAAAATAAAERLVTSDKVNAIMGADCSGVTGAILQNVARPNGIVMISPSATSPGLSTAEDDGLFFRTAPSDARQGEVMSDIMLERGIKTAAVTYVNSDYGKGLADSFQAAYEKAGGKVTISAAHEDGKADYNAEVGALASAGGDALVVAGYNTGGGLHIIRTAVENGAFETFVLPDGMVGGDLTSAVGPDLNGSFGQKPGSDSEGVGIFAELAAAAGFPGDATYAPESYDAAALILLAMQKAGSSSSADFKAAVMDVANAPGEKIMPGELKKAFDILAGGGDIDYVGATAVELVGPGEAAGSFLEMEVKDGAFVTLSAR